MFKRISFLVVSILLASVFVANFAYAGSEKLADFITEQDIFDDSGTVIGTSVKAPADKLSSLSFVISNSCPNFYKSTEFVQLMYSARIQFKSSYLTQVGDGYNLLPCKHVKYATINYVRSGKSVCGGRQKTSSGTSKYDATIRYVTATCLDDLLDWTPAATTYFYANWYYF